MKSLQMTSRLASIGLFVVLLLLAGASTATAMLNQQAVNAVETSSNQSALYRQVLYAIASEESTQYEYALRPSLSLRNEHRTAEATTLSLLEELQQVGEDDVRATTRQVIGEQKSYVLASNAFFAAVDVHNIALARAIHYQQIDPVFDHIQLVIEQQAKSEQSGTTGSLIQLAQVQLLTITATPIMFVVGLVIIAFLWRIIRHYQRKLDQSVRTEMARLERMALTDALTGLGNHYAYQEQLAHAGEKIGQGSSLVLALLDLDELKLFNDEYGHQRGDEMLLNVVAILREASPGSALFRLSGDDFALLKPQTTLAEMLPILEQIRGEIERRVPGMTASIGAAEAGDSLACELLAGQAQAALLEAKRQGRNRVLSFEAVKRQVQVVSSAKLQALRRLLGEADMQIAFQPIWNLASGEILGFEALARPAADYGFAGPQEMFDIAEYAGRAHELDLLCIRAILARASLLPPGALLFLNLTPRTLVHDLLAGATLLESVTQSGLAPSQVVLEITERSIVEVSEIIHKVNFLRSMGFRVALDDVGAGNAGLEMLSQLSVDMIKIDRMLINHALTDRAAHSVIVGITTIAREMRAGIVVEGIETPEMLVLAQQLDGQYVQGYLLGRPGTTIPQTEALQRLSPRRHIATSRAVADGELALSGSES